MTESALADWPFMKMHGLGNDFLVLDARTSAITLKPELIRALADRRRGVGFDQLAVISEGQDLTLTFYNADGSASAACGNATRCIADREMRLEGKDSLRVRVTGRGDLSAIRRPDGIAAVNMGAPQLEWHEIPLAHAVDSLHLPLAGDPVGTGMGNPHCTFFVDDVDGVDLSERGPMIEHDPLFPERTNVQFAEILNDSTIRMRVWERGTGITLASGSSSCATAVAAARRGLTGRKTQVVLDGGILDIDWREDGVWMAGPTAHVFDGVLTRSFLDQL